MTTYSGLNVEDPTPPSPPRWVQKSIPEEWPERGIDAHESAGIYLEWEPDLEGDIVAYNIYRTIYFPTRDSLGDYEHLVHLELESLLELNYLDTQIDLRKIYFYIINSVDGALNISNFSDEYAYTLLPQISSHTMVPNSVQEVLSGERKLRWQYGHSVEMEDYIVTILSADDQLITRISMLPGNYIGSSEYWQIPEDILLLSGNRYKWRVDIGAKYLNGLESSGSESQWATFLYQEDSN